MPAPRCPKHPTKDMVRINQGIEVTGEGWNRHQAYYEDYLCEVCKFRLRLYYLIMDIGR